MLIIAAICLFLTDCDSRTSHIQQSSKQAIEQSVSAVSICTATITEINGTALTVKNVDGSCELNSSDKFSLPASLLNESINPAIGMIIEIAYNGCIS